MDLSHARWRKSSRSAGNNNQCVEVAAMWRKSSRSGATGNNCVEAAPDLMRVAIRDSKDPYGPRLAVPARAWEAFTGRIRRGVLDA